MRENKAARNITTFTVFDDGPQPAVQLVQDETITAVTEWQQYWIPVSGDMFDDVPASTAQHLPCTNASDANTECDPRKLVEDLQKWAVGNNIHVSQLLTILKLYHP